MLYLCEKLGHWFGDMAFMGYSSKFCLRCGFKPNVEGEE